MPKTRTNTTVPRILDAARGLFIERNYADVTMSQIARAADVTKGGLYHHFTSKEELYVQVLTSDFEEKRVLFAQAVETRGSCRERLVKLTRAFLELPRERRQLIRLVRRDINIFKNPVRDELVRCYQCALPEQVETILCAGIEAGEIASSDARLLSWQFVAMVEVVLTPYADRQLDTEAKLDMVLNLFFRGAAAPPKGADDEARIH